MLLNSKTIKIGKLELSNPIMPASGTFGYGIEFKDFFDLNILGAIVTKSLSLDENIGNAPPRISEVTNGLINSIGLENIGLERFKREIAPEFNKLNTNIIVSFFGKSLEDFCIFAKKIEVPAAKIEIPKPPPVPLTFAPKPKLKSIDEMLDNLGAGMTGAKSPPSSTSRGKTSDVFGVSTSDVKERDVVEIEKVLGGEIRKGTVSPTNDPYREPI